MKISGDGKLLRIFVGESDRCEGRSLYEAIVLKAREVGLAGATVWRGMKATGRRVGFTPRRSYGSLRTFRC